MAESVGAASGGGGGGGGGATAASGFGGLLGLTLGGASSGAGSTATEGGVLVTLGLDEMGSSEKSGAAPPTLKFWALDKPDSNGVPFLMRSIPLVAAASASAGGVAPATALACLPDLSQIAVGLCNGAIVILRGRDISRDRATKQRIVFLQRGGGVPKGASFDGKRGGGVTNPDALTDPITSLHWRAILAQNGAGGSDTPAADVILFAVTMSAVFSLWTTRRDFQIELGDLGAELQCASQTTDGDVVIARSEAVYFYMPETQGICFGFEGRKQMVHCFRTYLVVVTQNESVAADSGGGGGGLSTVHVYDLKNKFIAFYAARMPTIVRICEAWGTLLLFGAKNGAIFQLEEKDMQTKLEMLFKRNLYSQAIDLAHSQQYDYNSIVDIFRKYGDHLYDKGDFDGAMAQYISTIGRLEPSYVIRKYLDAQRIYNLTSYLQALHAKGLANSDHTTLLCYSYTKLKDVDKLSEFIRADAGNFDVHTAIRVCRQAGYHRHALYLAKVRGEHEWVLKVLLEDLHDYEQALRYLATLDFFEAESSMRRYGKILMDEVPEKTTHLLMELCTNYAPLPLTAEELDERGMGDKLHASHTYDQSGASGAGAAATRSNPSPKRTDGANDSEKLNQMGDHARAMMSRVADSSIVKDAMRSFSARRDTSNADASIAQGAANDNAHPFRSNSAVGGGGGNEPHSASNVGASQPAAVTLSGSGMRAQVNEFIHIFVNQPDWLVRFLEYMVTKDCNDPQAYNTLLELYLKDASSLSDAERDERHNKAFDLLTDPQATLDVDQAMMLCRMHRFRRGLLRLYELQGMFRDIVQFYMETDDYANVIRTVKKHGDKDPNLWISILSYFAKRPQCQQEIRDVLSSIDRDSILPPLLVIQTLARHENVPLSVVKDFIVRRVKLEERQIEEDERLIASTRDDTARMRSEIDELRTGAVIFQSSKCSNCTSPIDLPAIHFLCRHSFHTRCLGENEGECPLCAEESAKVIAYKRAQEANAANHERFFKQLAHTDDGFGTVATYFGRGIFGGNEESAAHVATSGGGSKHGDGQHAMHRAGAEREQLLRQPQRRNTASFNPVSSASHGGTLSADNPFGGGGGGGGGGVPSSATSIESYTSSASMSASNPFGATPSRPAPAPSSSTSLDANAPTSQASGSGKNPFF